MNWMLNLILLVGVVLLNGCNVKLNAEVPLLPNVKGMIPENSFINTTNSPTTDPTKQSQKEAQTPQKTVIINLIVSSQVQTGTGIVSNINCVQLVELADKRVVIDFSDQPCPAQSTQSAAASSIRFTATYAKLSNGTYELSFHGAKIGSIQIDFDAPKVTLLTLCTSSYYNACYLSVNSNGRIDDILTF